MKRFCPNCGSELIKNAKFCAKCGKDVSSLTQMSEETKAEKHSTDTGINRLKSKTNVMKKYPWFIGILTALIIVGILFFFKGNSLSGTWRVESPYQSDWPFKTVTISRNNEIELDFPVETGIKATVHVKAKKAQVPVAKGKAYELNPKTLSISMAIDKSMLDTIIRLYDSSFDLDKHSYKDFLLEHSDIIGDEIDTDDSELLKRIINGIKESDKELIITLDYSLFKEMAESDGDDEILEIFDLIYLDQTDRNTIIFKNLEDSDEIIFKRD